MHTDSYASEHDSRVVESTALGEGRSAILYISLLPDSYMGDDQEF